MLTHRVTTHSEQPSLRRNGGVGWGWGWGSGVVGGPPWGAGWGWGPTKGVSISKVLARLGAGTLGAYSFGIT